MITKSILLECNPPRAFELFTERISDWWPPERRHTGDPTSTIVMLPSGSFFERGKAGTQVQLGAVLEWHPPERLLLDWYPGTDPLHPTRVEVKFVPEGPKTRVVVVHTATESSAELFPLRAPKYEASWALVLEALRGAQLAN